MLTTTGHSHATYLYKSITYSLQFLEIINIQYTYSKKLLPKYEVNYFMVFANDKKKSACGHFIEVKSLNQKEKHFDFQFLVRVLISSFSTKLGLKP